MSLEGLSHGGMQATIINLPAKPGFDLNRAWFFVRREEINFVGKSHRKWVHDHAISG